MQRRISLKELIHNAGVIIPADGRQPCLPAPTQPAITASEEDHAQARNILLDRRTKNPENKNVLKSIFRSSKEKERLQELGQFSQEELDQALSAVIHNPTTGPGLIQAFLSLGAKVNIIETPEKKKKSGNQSNTSLRRRSTVLQQAATSRKADSVGLLASSGADQTTLDEGLKAALTANDQACIQELLRHGANINNFPTALANAVRSNDQNYVRLLLRAPKPLRPEIISSCLPAAVQQKSSAIVSLLITYGADPNFDSSSALNTTIGKRDFKLAAALVSGPIPLTGLSLQRLLDTTMRLPTCEATLQFLQLLFCCGLPPNSIGLPDLLINRIKKDDTAGAMMMISYGVPTTTNEAECLKVALINSNWTVVAAILQTAISPQLASVALTVLPSAARQPDRMRVIKALIQKGATGPALDRWLTQAAKEGDTAMIEILLSAGASVHSDHNSPLRFAIMRKDTKSLRLLLKARPSPEALANVFPPLRDYSPSERRETSVLLLEAGARGPEVDQALVDAVADTSAARDGSLIIELVRRGANVNYDNGKVFTLAAAQADLSLLRLLCNSKPTSSSTSSALPLAFDTQGNRRTNTLEVIDLLLSHGMDEGPALPALQIAISGGPDNIDIVKRLIVANTRLLSPALKYAITLEDSKKKAPILEALLTMGVTQETLDQALAVETRNAVFNKDVTSTKLLLGQGASVSHNDGEALSVAVASGSSSLTEILLSGNHQPSRSSVTKAFRTLFADENIQGTSRSEKSLKTIARELLDRGVDQLVIDSALRSVLCNNIDSVDIETLVDLLLKHGANVNAADGACFIFAAQKQNHAIFEQLMLHNPKFNIVVAALLSSNLEDQIVVDSIESCFKHGCASDELEAGRYKTPVLILAMQEYPRNEPLVKLLLNHGCNPDISTQSIIDPSVGEETVSALLWALNQAQKKISDPVIAALLEAGASVTRAAPISEIAPVALAAREGRHELIQALLERGSDASARDKWNRSALFYASSAWTTATVQVLAPHALKNDSSLHEAARCLQLDAAAILTQRGHDPNFPSRIHNGRNALGELCLNAQITSASHRSKVRQLIRLFLDNGANPKFRARNEKSAVVLALDNAYNALEISEALLETEMWEDLNDEKHMYRDTSGLWYSPLKYVELIPSPSRAASRQELLDLLRDKGCEPKYYSETAEQPRGAIGMPAPIARIFDQQKEHELSLKHAQESHDHARTLEETTHRDILRRNRESQDAEIAAQAAAQQHRQTLEQQKHEFEVQRVRAAEHMKRSEKAAWHNLIMEQERDASARRQSVEDRKASATIASEAKLIEQRKAELEHKSGVERRMLKEKEDLYDRNVKRQIDDRPAIEGTPQWGTVD
ncbi:ankyrin [Cucurbitaria berberidis CBS 394.84]|uniref:Ankyrin n=1 Tax=Cucurbitaria berberidis CBS 394.84 TaxID=1168544 RepID=A0A9P4GV85_9PLEO|nr:ankyrin [Cucurbitaria berberidis CBS 394.84]KAF1851904.1 ankyrin [Cucurbitaria berberidis CBS 394.84]